MSHLIILPMLAAVPEPGGYFSTFKIFLMLVLMVPWLRAATWLNKDAVRVHTSQLTWSALTLGSGVLSLLIWLLLPWYVFGLAVYVLVVGSVIGTYIVVRNKRVVPQARVLTSEHLRTLFVPKKQRQVQVVERVKLYDKLGRPVFAPPEEAQEERENYNLVQKLLNDVVVFRASDVDLTTSGNRASLRYVVDGVLQDRPAPDRLEAERIIDFIKNLAGMDVQEKRRPQTGKISLEAGAVTLDGAVASAGTTHGRRLRLRIVQEAARTNLNDLGMPDDLRERLEKMNASPSGLIIVCGPRGNGVTSTLYSLLRRHDSFMFQLTTLEASPSVELENITANVYRDRMDLPGRLASVLRRDPDVVMVDRCDTAQTAELIWEAAGQKNILLGSTGESSFVALAKWVKLAGDNREEAMRVLKAVVCQVLLRKLCPNCKEAYRPARDLLSKLNLSAEKIDKFYRTPTEPLTDEKGKPIVCPTCRGTGYYGRTGAFELLEVTDEIRQLVCQDASLSRIKAVCRKNKMLYLQEQALRKVIEGVTSIEEVIRVSKTKQ